ncbi:hypothetical protein QC761_301390 [Podospora bellae-mahoneyi]|uniref:FAD-binding domain-containing protein n=1 Tax=Podospora bellae-mahoneyi TaxID=2093777 RepID=A0ABR0FJB7_9PEZI|nr:hypothetical protein QC761_301390 [Podospora bellae-mahoneyi]
MPPTMDISVIIVGGGPVGLTAAHAFSKLGIDFALLERRDIIAEDVGASIVLWPHGIRIMAQLGLLDQLLSIGTELMSGTFQTVNGKAFLRTSSPQLCKTKIHTSKTVTSISSVPGGGIKVLCLDGTSYTGSFTLGADGIHSVSTPKNLCLQVLANEKSNVQFCFLYQLLLPDNSPSKKFTQSDIEAIISRPDVSSRPLGGSGLTVKDAWRLKSKCGITPLEEGILKPEWHFGNQMVLVGDAAHKVTPTIGQGLNMGLLDVVSLANQVSEFVGSAGSSREKVLGGLDGAFRRYRAERLESVEKDYKRSGVVTRLTCWREWRFKLFDRVVMPIPGVDVLLVNKVNSPIMARGLVFRGIRVEREPFEGRVKWKEKMPLLDKTAHDEERKESGG